MPTTKAVNKPSSEPVSLALFKSHLRLNPDEIIEDDLLKHYLSAARAKAEKYCNQFFASRVVETTFSIDELYQLPSGAGLVSSVRGYITNVEDLPNVNNYWIEYVKGISVLRNYPIDYNNLPTYTVTYPLMPNPEEDVIDAILKIASDLYENRENSVTGVVNNRLSINYQILLNPYRVIN